MTDSNKAFWLGLFIVVTLGLLIWFVLFLKPIIGDGKGELKVRFSNIDKISKGSLVTYAGKPIGKVVSIVEVKNPHDAKPDSSGNLYVFELTLEVDSSVQVYSYDEILFATAGLLGEKSISIIPKATPSGAPKARNITKDTLYAQSTDKVDQALSHLSSAATALQCTLEDVSGFIKGNQSEFNLALRSLKETSYEFDTFITKTCSTELVEKMARASDRLSIAAAQAECLFMSIDESSLLPQLHAILNDIQTYGILYQFDRKWKRKRTLEKRLCTEIIPER